MFGLFLRTRFPEGHLDGETKEVVKLVVGVVGTMTGMVLGLLVASAKSTFDSQRSGLSQLAANVVVLDRALEFYGPETKPTRDLLRDTVQDMMHRIWPDEFTEKIHASHDPKEQLSKDQRQVEVYERILEMEPKTERQKITHAQALKVVHDTAQMRWLLYSQRNSSIPAVFLVLLVAWLAISFASYGLFAPRHRTTYAVLLLGSLVVSSAVFLILELDHPFSGVMRISSQPMVNALAQMDR